MGNSSEWNKMSRTATGITEEWLKETQRRMGKGGVKPRPAIPLGRRKPFTSRNIREDSQFHAFIVHGIAIGKPRMTQRDKWQQRPAVMRYRAWCDQVRAAVGWIHGQHTLACPVKMTLRIFLSCPDSWPRKKRLLHNGTPHTAKPDVDNIAKGIMDALFTNDSYVFKIDAAKYWTEENPHVAVTIEEVQP